MDKFLRAERWTSQNFLFGFVLLAALSGVCYWNAYALFAASLASAGIFNTVIGEPRKAG